MSLNFCYIGFSEYLLRHSPSLTDNTMLSSAAFQSLPKQKRTNYTRQFTKNMNKRSNIFYFYYKPGKQAGQLGFFNREKRQKYR